MQTEPGHQDGSRHRLADPAERAPWAPAAGGGSLPDPLDGRTGTAVAVTLLTAVVLRFVATSPLWLDEALTVNIARLPLSRIPEALARDGSPPFYYLLLHGWMRLWGQGDVAVRALSGLLSVVSLPLAYAAGRRLGGRSAAWAAVLLLASSPFAVRYATETRMYALEVLLSLAGVLTVLRALERPSTGRLAAVATTTAALLYTHYWSLYLVAAAGVVLWRAAAGRPAGHPARATLRAVAVGIALFVPWVPVFAYQTTHTGTPWAAPPTPVDLLATVWHFAGGRAGAGLLLALLLAALAVRALVRAPGATARAGWLAALAGGTLGLAFVAAVVAGSTFEPRYTAVAFGPFVLLVALGAASLAGTPPGRAVVGAAVVLGLVASTAGATESRTQAGQVAAAIDQAGRPGDVVAYCPDQLGPAVSRLLGPGYVQLTFPDGDRPEVVDWVDYGEGNADGDPAEVADLVLDEAGPDQGVFVVWAAGYRTLGTKCERLLGRLRISRTATTLVRAHRRYYEPMSVLHFAAPRSAPGAHPSPA